MIVDPLPRPVLHQFVSQIPGPPNETQTERSARFDHQLAEVLAYHPRDAAEAMMATHCIMLRLIAAGIHRDAKTPGLSPTAAKQHQRLAKQYDKQIAATEQALARNKQRPLGQLNPALYAALGIEPHLIPDPDDPDQIEEAASAIIVPLHPAPKMLQ